jgi:hypothetical protein
LQVSDRRPSFQSSRNAWRFKQGDRYGGFLQAYCIEQNSRSNHVGRRNGAIDCAFRPSASIPRPFYFVAPIQFRNGVARTSRLSLLCAFDEDQIESYAQAVHTPLP